jgi:hypothetical protein
MTMGARAPSPAGRHLTRAIWLCVAIGSAAACEDMAVALGPDNNVIVTNQATSFRLQVSNMDNVIDATSYTWVSPDSQAKILHRSLVPHGVVDIKVLDPNSLVLYQGSLVYETDTITAKGKPGPWTIQFQMKAATGKIDVTLEKP